MEDIKELAAKEVSTTNNADRMTTITDLIDKTRALLEGLEFDLNNDNFFEKVEGYGIRLIPKNGFPVSVPGYGYNNGHYTTNLTLIIAKKYIEKEYDITECQDIEG